MCASANGAATTIRSVRLPSTDAVPTAVHLQELNASAREAEAGQRGAAEQAAERLPSRT